MTIPNKFNNTAIGKYPENSEAKTANQKIKIRRPNSFMRLDKEDFKVGSDLLFKI